MRKRWEANGKPPWWTWPLLWPLLDIGTFKAFLIVLGAIPIVIWVSTVWGIVLLVLGLAAIGVRLEVVGSNVVSGDVRALTA